MRILSFIIVGFSGFLYAAPPEYVQAVLASEQLVSLTKSGLIDIIKIEQTERLRCPGCFQFLVSLGDFPDVESTVSLYTEDSGEGIEVHLIE